MASTGLSLDPDDTSPLHQQVEKLLRRLAGDKAHREGKLIPPEQELAERLGVSRQTAFRYLATARAT